MSIRHPLYNTWHAIHQRCYNKNSPIYKHYGGRGIKMCDRWRYSFDNFCLDMGAKPSDNHSIDRFPNNDGDYDPSNIRWATRSQQARNTRKTIWLIWDEEWVKQADLVEMFATTVHGIKKNTVNGVFNGFLNKPSLFPFKKRLNGLFSKKNRIKIQFKDSFY